MSPTPRLASARRERGALDQTVSDLRERADSAFDWETHYRAHTRLHLSLAVATGMLIGLVSVRHEPDTRTGRLFHTAATTLTSLAAAAAADAVEELIPGIREGVGHDRW